MQKRFLENSFRMGQFIEFRVLLVLTPHPKKGRREFHTKVQAIASVRYVKPNQKLNSGWEKLVTAQHTVPDNWVDFPSDVVKHIYPLLIFYILQGLASLQMVDDAKPN